MKKLIFFIITTLFFQAEDVFTQTSDSGAQVAAILGGLFIWGIAFFWFLLWFLFFIGIFSFSFGVIAFWIWMLVDCAKRKFEKENDKTTWILVLTLSGWIGAIIYYVMIKRKT